MSWEKVNESVESLQKGFADYKDANEKRLKEIEEKGTAPLMDAELKKRDEAFDKLEKKFESSVAALNRTKIETEISTGEVAKEAKEISNEIMRKGEKNVNPEKVARLIELNGPQYKLLSSEIDPNGGYAVRPQVENSIKEYLYESSPMRQLAEVMTIGTDAWEELYESEDDIGGGHVGETQARTETSTKELKMLRIDVHEIYAEPKATQRNLDDSFFDVEAWHQSKVNNKFSRIEADDFINGNGILKPRGILDYAAGDGFNKLEQLESAAASVVDGDDLISLQDKLYEQFQANAAWMMTRASRSAVRKLKDEQGRYMFSIDQMAGLNGGQPFMLLDKPIHLAADMPQIAGNALAIAYGDFRQAYKIIDRVGIRIIRDSITQKGFVKFYTTKRYGGGVQQFQALKLLKVKSA